MMMVALVLAVLQQPTAPAPPPSSQTALPPLPSARADTSPFLRLALPTPTLLRQGSGRPGPRYWQQRGDYTIAGTLATATPTSPGHATIRSTHHAPDTL